MNKGEEVLLQSGKYRGEKGVVVDVVGTQVRVALNGHIFTYAITSLRHTTTPQADKHPGCLNREACNRQREVGNPAWRCHFLAIGPPWHCTQYAPDGKYDPEVPGIRCPICESGCVRVLPTGWRWCECECGYVGALMEFKTEEAITPLG